MHTVPHPTLPSVGLHSEQLALEHLERYVQLGWCVVPLLPGTKRPYTKEWNRVALSPAELRKFYRHHPQHGMGLMHAQSGTLVLDVDREAETRIALEAFHIDLDELLLGPRILSAKGAKPIFRLPPDLAQGVRGGQRGLHTLKWPDPSLPNISYSVFELRTGFTQDALPPSLHPSGIRYRWAGTPPQEREDIPLLGGKLLELYLHFAALKSDLEARCPWPAVKADPPARAAPPLRPRIDKGRPTRLEGRPSAKDVMQAFNRVTSVRSLLEAAGYQAVGATRYRRPGSQNGAGVELFPASTGLAERVLSSHAACPLNDGNPHDAFDVFKILECGGHQGLALDHARARLNLF